MKIGKFPLMAWVGLILACVGLIGPFFVRIPEYWANPMILGGILCFVIKAPTRKQIDPSIPPPSSQQRKFRPFILLGSILLGSILGLFAIQHSFPQMQRAVLIGSGVATLVIGSVIVFWSHFRGNTHSIFLTKKRCWIIGIMAAAFVASLIFSYLDRYGDECRRIDREVGIAITKLNNEPPGIERVENFLHNLRAIDTARAPVDVQKILNDYIETCASAITELRVTGKLGILDKEMGNKKKAFVETIQRYE